MTPTRTPVEWLGQRSGLPAFPNADFEVIAAEPTARGWRIDYAGEGESSRADVTFGDGLPGQREVYVDGPAGSLTLTERPRFTDPADAVASGSLLAPMPGSVVRIAAEVGAEVEAGAPVLVLEAMKMQHTVTAPHAGTVTEINVEPGQQVASGEVLAVVDPGE